MSSAPEEQTAALRRAALRLILAARGRSEALDTRLEALRGVLREDPDANEVDRAVDALGNALLELEGAAAEAERAPGGRTLERLLRRLGEQTGVTTHALAEDAAAAARDSARLESLLEGCIDALEQQQAAASAGQADRGGPTSGGGPGLLARLLPRRRHQEEPGASSGLIRHLRQRLATLVQEIVLPAPFNERLNALQPALSAVEGPDELVTIVDRLADVIVEASQAEAAELETFLLRLSERLADLHSLMRTDQQALGEAEADEASLGQAVHDRVQSIQTALRESRDPREAHRIISTDLDSLVEHVVHFRESQNERREQGRERSRALSERLHETEEESRRLRAALEEQQRRAERDPLTGLVNREGYDQRIGEELGRSARFGTPVSLLMCDIDTFKPVNDRHGHAVGDQVLTTVAHRLASTVRQTDAVTRYGGEEFAVILPGANLAQAEQAAEKLRRAVSDTPVEADALTLPVTISIGVAEAARHEAPESLFRRADAALYAAKFGGRDRVSTDS